MKPLLSIVIPVYNRAGRVVRTLDSVAAADYRPLELLIVDNGSSDDSLQVCRSWAEEHASAGIDVLVHIQSKPGANAARNRGLEHCRGEYVFFFDSDDLFCPAALSDVADAVGSDHRPDWLFLPVEQGVDAGSMQVRSYQQSSAPHVHLLNSQFSTGSMVFRTQWLREIGGWDEELSVWQDWELGARMLLHEGHGSWLCARTYHHILLHADSITTSGFSQTVEGTLAAMRRVVGEVKEASRLSEKERARCLRALYYRGMILAGKLRREGCADGAAAYRALVEEIIPHALKPVRLAGMMLSAYSAVGGRGAWRLALGLV